MPKPIKEHQTSRTSVDAAAALTRQPTKRARLGTLLKTGSTLLDLAISGSIDGGFMAGKYFLVVGDSSSGKTFLILTCLAEASIDDTFKDYRFIYDNTEGGALMDFGRFFGKRMARRIENPSDDGPSKTIEEFYYNLDDALSADRPCIYVLDSMDALSSDYGDSKFQDAKKAARRGTEAKGSYGDGKAKMNSTFLRSMMPRLEKTKSILIVVSQTRDNIGAGMYGEQKIFAGGHALKFYATAQVWSSVGGKIKRTVGERDVQIGVNCRVTVKKNRLTGKVRTVEFPILYESGIDDIGGMIDWLVYWKVWPNKGGLVDAGAAWPGVRERREDLVEWIEANDKREDLEDAVQEAWSAIEARIAPKRKGKYGDE